MNPSCALQDIALALTLLSSTGVGISLDMAFANIVEQFKRANALFSDNEFFLAAGVTKRSSNQMTN